MAAGVHCGAFHVVVRADGVQPAAPGRALRQPRAAGDELRRRWRLDPDPAHQGAGKSLVESHPKCSPSLRYSHVQFQRLALKWHPDRNQDPAAKEKFAKINTSYRLLMDIEKRRAYDRWLDDVHRDAQLSGSFDMPSASAAAAATGMPGDIFRHKSQDPNFTDNRAHAYADVRYRSASPEYRQYMREQQQYHYRAESTASQPRDTSDKLMSLPPLNTVQISGLRCPSDLRSCLLQRSETRRPCSIAASSCLAR